MVEFSPTIIMMLGIATLFGGYIITSYICLRFPRLLHKKKKLLFQAVHISHRGGAGENLENTLTAFQHALDQGTDMLEIDCHITADGQVVISHDNNLRRATGHDLLISETRYRDLPPLKRSLALDFQSAFVTHSESDDRRIPLLRELFEKFPDTPVNIDVKIDNDQLIHKISELAKEFHREGLIIWGSGRHQTVRKCLVENPQIATLFSFRRVLLLCLMYYTGVLPFVPLQEAAFEVVMPSIFLRKGKMRSEPGWKFRFLINFTDIVLMNRGLFRHLRERGIQTYLWVLNETDEFERAFSYGVSGVMTDFPTRLRHFLQTNPQFDRRKESPPVTPRSCSYSSLKQRE